MLDLELPDMRRTKAVKKRWLVVVAMLMLIGGAAVAALPFLETPIEYPVDI